MNDLLASLTEMRDPGAPVGPPAEKRRKTMPVPRISTANLKGCAIPRAPQGSRAAMRGAINGEGGARGRGVGEATIRHLDWVRRISPRWTSRGPCQSLPGCRVRWSSSVPRKRARPTQRTSKCPELRAAPWVGASSVVQVHILQPSCPSSPPLTLLIIGVLIIVVIVDVVVGVLLTSPLQPLPSCCPSPPRIARWNYLDAPIVDEGRQMPANFKKECWEAYMRSRASGGGIIFL